MLEDSLSYHFKQFPEKSQDKIVLQMKTDLFLAILDRFSKMLGKLLSFSKIRLNKFFHFILPLLHAKNQKNLMTPNGACVYV